MSDPTKYLREELWNYAADEIVCPYCGETQSDGRDYEGDSGEIECADCEKEFFYERNHEVTYSTSRQKEDAIPDDDCPPTPL